MCLRCVGVQSETRQVIDPKAGVRNGWVALHRTVWFVASVLGFMPLIIPTTNLKMPLYQREGQGVSDEIKRAEFFGGAGGQMVDPRKLSTSQSPELVKVTLFGNRVSEDVIKDLRMRSSWI